MKQDRLLHFGHIQLENAVMLTISQYDIRPCLTLLMKSGRIRLSSEDVAIEMSGNVGIKVRQTCLRIHGREVVYVWELESR
jgi:hypothetical protein